jgi:beta-galactosidase
VPGYRRAASWYKKDLYIPACKHEYRFILYFEGVNITSEIFVNGVMAGGHVGGYVGFEIDITSQVHQGKLNTIMVRVSNASDRNVIPSPKSDFFIYGGITRNVWLKVVPSNYLRSVKISTPKVSKTTAEVILQINVNYSKSKGNSFKIEAITIDKCGKEVGMRSVSTCDSIVNILMPNIKNPDLWSPDSPSLYTVQIKLRRADKVIDEISDRFGCRWFEFKDHGPFYLNGERLLLRGTQRHEDLAGYANAIPDSLQRKDMKMIKEMGANFVRLAHYPQAPEVYRACDELGLLVWDELPWCRGGVGGDVWKANTRRLLVEQIEQNYNHPSIIIHSFGNEMYWLTDFPNGDKVDSLRAMIKDLNEIARRLDRYRLTAIRKFSEGTDLVDVVSPSIWVGWYNGRYKDYEKAITEAKNKFIHFIHLEYGGDSHMGRHSENPMTGDTVSLFNNNRENITPPVIENIPENSDWSENYVVNLFDWYLHISEQLDWLTGNAQSTFKDFPSPLRADDPIPYINQKGLVDRAGNPKDAYYVFKSYWTTSPLFCYIESHTWTERNGPENLKRAVNVFSNCTEVELFLDGVTQGKHTRNIQDTPACGLSWQVNFKEGENRLLALGFKNNKNVTADSLAVTYSYAMNDIADHIILSSTKMGNGNILVTALAIDKNGRRCLDYNKTIYFTWDGPGKLYENYGTPKRSSIIEMANGKAQIEFEPASKGVAVIEAHNQDFKSAYLHIEAGH